MNAYTTTSQARIQPSDFSAALRANQLAGAPLADSSGSVGARLQPRWTGG